MSKVLVCGAGGFIGGHLVESLKAQGHYVVGADLKFPEYSVTHADQYFVCDLRQPDLVAGLITPDIDCIYQLAADMGGAGYIFTGDNDAAIMHNSCLINLNILHEMVKNNVKNIFYSSSACIYPAYNQTDPKNPMLSESSAYPAAPDSEYGWEKLFSERMFMAFAKNYGLNVKIARLHNVYGPFGSFNDGKEKAPAALCRKVFESTGTVDVWGPGDQTRSFMYIDTCVDGIHRLMSSDFDQPINLGSERMISINDLVMLIANVAGKQVVINNTPGPMGVMGRNSHNELIRQVLGWEPPDDLEYGITQTYNWISKQLTEVVII